MGPGTWPPTRTESLYPLTFMSPRSYGRRFVPSVLLLLVAACGDSDAGTTITSESASTQATTTAATTTVAVTTTEAATTTSALLTLDQITGDWNRESAEHGSEFVRFTTEGEFVYAEGAVENLDASPSIVGTFEVSEGVLTILTEDCGDVVGSYAPRLFGSFLEMRVIEDECAGRNEGLTFDLYERLSA